MHSLSVQEALERANALAASQARTVLGITGAPGAGKSTLARSILAAVPGSVVVGMDAFHLAHSVLTERGWVERKGAIHTFDGDGYVSLLRRIRLGHERTIWAPEFRREIEDAIASAVAVEPTTRLVITEGNYLLAEAPPWCEVPQLCDEVWYVDLPEDVRLQRLTVRHMEFGRSPDEAWERSIGSDGENAKLVHATRSRATATVRLD